MKTLSLPLSISSHVHFYNVLMDIGLVKANKDAGAIESDCYIRLMKFLRERLIRRLLSPMLERFLYKYIGVEP